MPAFVRISGCATRPRSGAETPRRARSRDASNKNIGLNFIELTAAARASPCAQSRDIATRSSRPSSARPEREGHRKYADRNQRRAEHVPRYRRAELRRLQAVPTAQRQCHDRRGRDDLGDTRPQRGKIISGSFRVRGALEQPVCTMICRRARPAPNPAAPSHRMSDRLGRGSRRSRSWRRRTGVRGRVPPA